MKSISLLPNLHRAARVGVTLFALLNLAGCALFGSAATAPTPLPTRTPFPTFTSTPLVATATPLATSVAPPVEATPVEPAPVEPAVSAPPAEATTPPTAAQITIASDVVNVRRAPATDAELVGMVTAGQQFEVTGRTAAGDWWQVCCVAGQSGWVFGELATVTNGDAAPIVADAPAVAGAPPATAAPAAQPEATATLAPPEAVAEAPVAPPDPFASSAGWFDPNAQYQIVHFKVLGLEENNGGIRDSSAQHLIFLTVLDQSGNGVDGAVVRNLVGDKSEAITGSKGSGKAEITMYYEPFKLAVASDPSGAVSSQVSNQMGLVFPHLPDLVGKLGDVNYEYGACPTIDIKCSWPISAIHFSYEITFQKVK
jgi:uncharacterized protein YraI